VNASVLVDVLSLVNMVKYQIIPMACIVFVEKKDPVNPAIVKFCVCIGCKHSTALLG